MSSQVGLFVPLLLGNNFVEYPCHVYIDGLLIKDVGKDNNPYVADKLTYGYKTAPDSVGDIVFSDGSAVAYSEDLTLTSAQQAVAVAVIFDATNNKAVGLVQNGGINWCTADARVYYESNFAKD